MEFILKNVDFIPFIALFFFWLDLASKEGECLKIIIPLNKIYELKRLLAAYNSNYLLLMRINLVFLWFGGAYGFFAKKLNFPLNELSMYLYIFTGVVSLTAPLLCCYKKADEMKEQLEEFEIFKQEL